MSQTVWQMKNDIVKYGGNGAQKKTGWESQCYKREIPKNRNIRKLWKKYKINLRQIRNSQEI